MKKFLLKLSSVLVPFIILLYIGQYYVSTQSAKGKRYSFQGDWLDLKNHNSDILLIGNSRTWVNVDPWQIQKATGKKTEVIGQDGQRIKLLWLKFKQYMKVNKKPQHVFLQFDPFFLNDRKDLYGIDNYRTCFYMNQANFSQMSDADGYTIWYEYLPLAAIDFDLMARIIMNHTVPEKDSYEKTHGFEAPTRKWSGDWEHPDVTRLDSISNYTDSFFVYCRNNKIKLDAYFTPMSSPSYHKFKDLNKLYEELNYLNNKYNMKVLLHNYNSDAYYNDSSLFYNHMHLDAKGVDFFMQKQFLKDSTIIW